MRITPKNWASFQHYKDRAPAWIKLHRGLLDDYDFQCLPVASKALAPMLWLIASECEGGIIDADPKRLAFRLRMTPKEVQDALNPLIETGFFIAEHDASNTLADGLPREEERRGEAGASAPPSNPPKPSKTKKTPLPDGFTASSRVLAWMAEKGYGQVDRHVENFVSYVKSNGKTYADWDEALMRAIRDDWAKLRTDKGKPEYDDIWGKPK